MRIVSIENTRAIYKGSSFGSEPYALETYNLTVSYYKETWVDKIWRKLGAPSHLVVVDFGGKYKIPYLNKEMFEKSWRGLY